MPAVLAAFASLRAAAAIASGDYSAFPRSNRPKLSDRAEISLRSCLWMGEPLTDFSTKGVSSSSCLCHSTYGSPGCEHSCASCKNEDYEAAIASGHDDLVVDEIGTSIAQVMHAYDDEGTDQDEDLDENEDHLLSLESDSTDDLVDVENEVVISAAFSSGDASESLTGKSDDLNSSTNGTPKLVSAMKGTRAKRGIITGLSVSWAPDVYDPPVTSDSHTVKTHQRSSRKSHYKYKPSKSSSGSSRSSNGTKKDKKHSRHSSSSSNSSKKDRKHSYRSSSSSIISRIDSSVPQYQKGYDTSSCRTDASVLESPKVSPLVPAASPTLPEVVPVLKTMEQTKCGTNYCKEKPFTLLSRQFAPARYKGMFSFWSQNQLAS
ncbi:hypothetical protein ACP70R_036562 [Stipagrostis hirtigluma subsp. patula]